MAVPTSKSIRDALPSAIATWMPDRLSVSANIVDASRFFTPPAIELKTPRPLERPARPPRTPPVSPAENVTEGVIA